MAIVVKDPKSDDKIAQTLNSEQTKQLSIPVGDRFLKTRTAELLAQYSVEFQQYVFARRAAEGNKINSVSIADAALDRLKLHNTCYLNVINEKIRFKTYPPIVRNFFLMTIGSAVLPSMTSRADILHVSHKISSGNAALINMELTPPKDFTAEENHALYLNYDQTFTALNIASEILINATILLNKKREICKALCTTIRKELDFHYMHLPNPTKRDFMRNWGIVYEAEKKTIELNILALFADGSGITQGAEIRIGIFQTKATKRKPTFASKGAKGMTDAHGCLILKTTQKGDLFLVAKLAGCEKLVYPITIIPGEDLSVTLHFVKLPPEE